MAETSAVLLLAPKQRTTEAAEKLIQFVRRAVDRPGLTARDDVTGGLITTLPLHEEKLGRFLSRLREVLPPFGELVPLRVAIHVGELDRGLPDEATVAVLHRLVDTAPSTRRNGPVEVLMSDQLTTDLAWEWRAPPERSGQAIRSLALTLNGKQVITGHADGVIRRWDTSTGAPAGKPFTRHGAEVCAIAVTPDGEQVVSGDVDGVICRWHAASLDPIGDRPSSQNGAVRGVATTPDSRQFITGTEDGRLFVWNIADGRRANIIGDQGSPMRVVVVKPDGAAVLAGTENGKIFWWVMASGKLFVLARAEHSGAITSLAMNLDSDYVVSGGADGTIRVSHLAPDDHRDFSCAVGSTVLSLAVTPDGQVVSGCADGALRRWELATGEPVGPPWTGHQGEVTAVAVTPDGRLILSGGADGVLRRWDARTGAPVTEAAQLAEVASDRESDEDALGISSDVRTIATVLAAVSTQPPLSVALLGDWGAGKSSFMRHCEPTSTDCPQATRGTATGTPLPATCGR